MDKERGVIIKVRYYSSKYYKLLIGVSIAIAVFLLGCGGPVKEEMPVEPQETILEKKDLIKKGRAFDHFSKASLYEKSGNLEKAIEEYRLALVYDPESEELRRSLADLEFHLRRYDEVINVLSGIENQTIDDFMLMASSYNKSTHPIFPIMVHDMP